MLLMVGGIGVDFCRGIQFGKVDSHFFSNETIGGLELLWRVSNLLFLDGCHELDAWFCPVGLIDAWFCLVGFIVHHVPSVTTTKMSILKGE